MLVAVHYLITRKGGGAGDNCIFVVTQDLLVLINKTVCYDPAINSNII